MNWCLTIGQFYASIDMNFNQLCITSLCEYEFPTMLPIVVSNKLNENRILPALCSENGFRRMESIFLPPASFTIITPSLIRDCNKNSMEELEVDLFKFLVDQINDSDCIYTVSSRYFQGFSTDQRQGCRWFNLFSGAEGNDSNISSSTSLSTVEYTDKSSKICLFAWSKPIYARMIHEEVYCKQLNRKDNNTDVISSSMPTSDFPFRVMAQSLGCLHARYVPVDSLSKRIPSSVFSSSLLLDQFTSSSSSSRQYHCEGTAHGLLLDLFGLPVIDRTGELFIKHHQDKNYPASGIKSDSFMIPCRSLDMFLKGLMRLIMLWCSSNQSLSNAKIHSSSDGSSSGNGINTNNIRHHDSTIAIDQDIVNSIIESKEIDAFLVDHLQLCLSFNIPSSIISNSSLLHTSSISRRLIAYLLNKKLFLDSTLGANIFANLSQILPDHSTQLIYLLSGSINDPILHNTIQSNNNIIEDSILLQIINCICPYGGQSKISLIQFIQGFINLALSIQPDLTTLINQTINSTFLSQLENYLVSHGVKQRRARHELSLLYPSPPLQLQTSSSLLLLSSVNQIESEILTTSNTTDHLSTGQSMNEQATSLTSFDQIRSKSQTFNQQSTRFDTTLNNAMQAAAAPFIRLSKETGQIIDNLQSVSTFWSHDNTSLPEYLTTRLHRILSNPSERSTGIGRIGELYIYHTLLEYIHRNEHHQSNFDEVTSYEFPTGHPILGVGRLIRCNWCNADTESLRPYDVEVDVQVECDANKWEGLLRSLKDELANNVVRVLRSPSSRQDTSSSYSSSRSGLLSVGPIFLEVKSTVKSATNHNNSNNNDNNNNNSNNEMDINAETDLFEFSLPEVVCASQQGWRYHLLRVIWKTDINPDVLQMTSVSSSAPKVIHIPDLAGVLKQKSVNLRLCLAMLRSE
ncbi:unnamed protein product [Heterobilharzia americana]|nr:unnamed protein product [Heterobilharzia americana]